MTSFGVMLRSRAGYLDGILVIVDERQIAEEIAIELRGKGHDHRYNLLTPMLVIGRAAIRTEAGAQHAKSNALPLSSTTTYPRVRKVGPMPTTLAVVKPTADPQNVEPPKVNTPPSAARKRYPPPAYSGSIATIGELSLRFPVDP